MRAPLSIARTLTREQHSTLRRRAIFECGKWDPQYGDECVLADFALSIEPESWREVATLAERLAREALAAEEELVRRTDLHAKLGLPRSVRRALRECHELGPSAGAARVMRFDFHWTTDGWRISEVNSDVPGGFVEASGVSALVAAAVGLDVAGDPTAALADAVARRLAPGAAVALVHATAYTDDRQVMVHVARGLEARGLRTALLAPTQITWRDGRASAGAEWFSGAIDLIVRFFPGEWLCDAPSSSGWQHFFRGSRTPICNPGASLLVQSKRFPLVWDDLECALDTWRSLLPETRSPRDAPWRGDAAWLVKPALGRVGELIGLREVLPQREWRAIARSARWWPGDWIAQRRFEAVAVERDGELLFPCIGVYVIDDRAAGIYGRVARRPLIDARARDVAVLLQP